MPNLVFHDLSFELNGKITHFSFTEHESVDLLVFSSLGRIGQIVEVIYPEPIVSEFLSSEQRVEYDTKLLLGANEANADLFIRRVVILLAARNRRKRLIISLGFDDLTTEQIANAIDKLNKQL